MSDPISPDHYKMFDIETITIIAHSMNKDQWLGFCLGNALKYRIRAGKKDDADQDLAKANNFELLFNKHKDLCHE